MHAALPTLSARPTDSSFLCKLILEFFFWHHRRRSCLLSEDGVVNAVLPRLGRGPASGRAII